MHSIAINMPSSESSQVTEYILWPRTSSAFATCRSLVVQPSLSECTIYFLPVVVSAVLASGLAAALAVSVVEPAPDLPLLIVLGGM